MAAEWNRGEHGVDPPAEAYIRRWGRTLITNRLLFDVFAWAYAGMTTNPVWLANSARLLDNIPDDDAAITVLDLGAGPGTSALAMGERRPNARLIALDLTASMLALARKNRARAGWSAQRLTLVQGDALRIPLADASADVVTGHSFLYLLPEQTGVLSEAHRVLRPGGQVAFLEPRAGEIDWGWLGRQSSAGLQISLSLWRVYSWLHGRFSAARLQDALAVAGFVDIITEVTLGGFGIFGRGRKA